MKVPLALLADYANKSSEGKLNIMGAFSIIWTQSFPVIHPAMSLVFRIEAGNVEAERDHEVEIRLVDEEGKPLFSLKATFVFKQGAPGEAQQMDQIVWINNAVFPREGRYAFHILIDNREDAAVSLRVVKRPS